MGGSFIVSMSTQLSSTSCIRSLSEETITTRKARAWAWATSAAIRSSASQSTDSIIATPNASTMRRTFLNCGFRSSGGSVRLAL